MKALLARLAGDEVELGGRGVQNANGGECEEGEAKG